MKAIVWYYKNSKIVGREIKDIPGDPRKFLYVWWNRDNIFDMTSRWLTEEEFELELRKGVPRN